MGYRYHIPFQAPFQQLPSLEEIALTGLASLLPPARKQIQSSQLDYINPEKMADRYDCGGAMPSN